jgi:hemerythrin-like domain-containing protein
MHATELLMSEHRVIEQVLNCLEKIADQCTAGKPLDLPGAYKAIDFLQQFADRCHHGKEEHQLFPMMEARGFILEKGPTGVMVHEHDLGRQHIQAMLTALKDATAGLPRAGALFVEEARGYIQLLREHIRKEDHCLFPMADQALTEQDQRRLEDSFEKVEHEEMGEGTHEKYLRMADELADRYHVPRAVVPAGHGCGCGHHS